MIEGATVTMPLDEFDKLRTDSKYFRRITQQIAECFEYSRKENEAPAQCITCRKDSCNKCKVFDENPLYEESLTVDTKRLINFTKQYALYGKDIEADVGEMKIIEKKKRNGNE